jgi:flagellar protein FliO/FliZ
VTFGAVLARATARPHARVLLLGAAGGAGVLLLLATPGDLASAASRAVLVAAGIGALAVLVRRSPARAPAAVRIVTRAPLAREAGVAVVEVDGRRLLVGFGAAGVRVLSRLDAPEGDRP